MNISTSTNIAFERADGSRISTFKSIEMCAQAGYKELDLCFIDLTTVDTPFTTKDWKKYIEDLKKYINKFNIKFTQAHSTIHDFTNLQLDDEEQFDLVKRCIEASSILGIEWLVMHPSTKVVNNEFSNSTHQENVKYFQQVADYANEYGVGIAVENMWGTTKEGVKRYATKAEELLKLIQEIDRENVGACWDTQHAEIEKIDQYTSIKKLGKYLKATHISDMTSTQHVHILPYVGFINWEPIYKALAEINYSGSFTYEMQHYLLRMPMEFIPDAIKVSYEMGGFMINKINEYKRNI